MLWSEKWNAKRLTRGTAKIVGPVLFAVVLTRIDLSALKRTFSSADLLYVGLGLLGSFLVPVLRSFRWNLINRSLGVRMRFVDTAGAQFVGNAAALVTPARLGMELYRFLFARGLGHSAGRVVRGIVLDRLYDILPLALIFLTGVSNLKLGPGVTGAAVFGGLLLASAIPLIYILSRPDSRLLVRIMLTFTPKSLHRVQEVRSPGNERSVVVGPGNSSEAVLGFLFLSALVILVNTLRVDFFARSLGLHVGFMYMLWCVSAVVICNYLPVSIMGVGIRDVTLIYLLSTRGVGAEAAVFVSTLILVSLVLQALIGGGIYLLTGGSSAMAGEHFDECAG